MKRIIQFLLIISIFTAAVPYSASAEKPDIREFFVAVDGNDGNPGTKDRPFASIERAQTAVREINKNMSTDIIVYLREGVYCPENTLSFGTEDSGSNGYYVKYMAYENEKVKISGGDKVTGWEKYNDKIWKASYGDGSYVRQLYVDGKRGRRAQTEKLHHVSELYDEINDEAYKNDGLIIKDSRFASYRNQEDIQLHFGRGWMSVLLNVNEIKKTEKDESLFMMHQPIFDTAASGGHHPMKANVAVTVENAFEELDTEGEFYYNKNEKTLYYMPRDDEDMKTADIWAARLEVLVEIRGNKSSEKVKNIEFYGIDFAHAAWQRPSRAGLKNGQAQVFTADDTDEETNVPKGFVPACIQLEWAEKISFRNNTVKDTGAVGIGMYQGVSYCNIEGNVFADTADAAITVGLPNQTYEDEIYEGFNLAADKPATSSGSASDYPASAVFDVNNRSGWAQAGDAPAWVQADLLQPYRIDRIEVVGRQDMDQPSTRANFEIQASNDPGFGNYVILAKQGQTPFEHKGTCVLYSEDEGEYRYVRIKKSDSQYFFIAEMRVINEDMEYSPARESCKFNRIRNNYITRAGYVNWGAPAIQGYYVQNLDISHNEIYNVAYSGICVGWGWTTYPDSAVCRDNKVMYNRVHFNNMINFDGGSFYSLGQAPNTVVKGNYMSDQPNYIASLYSDNGTMYHTITENVAENVNQAFFVNIGTGYITYKDNYSPHSGTVMENNHTSAEQPVRYVPGNPPLKALQIIKNAGIENEWAHIKEKAGQDMWPVSPELTYANIRYDGIDDNKFMNNYLKSFITDAVQWMKLAKTGTDIGTYKESAYNDFQAFLNKALEITKKLPVDRDEIIKTRLEYESELEKFKAARNTLPMNEMISLAEEILNNTPVGVQVGNVSREAHNSLKEMIEAAKKDNTDIIKLMLERTITEFNAGKINLDITSFVLPEQLEDAVIDHENKEITVKVKHTADMTRAVPSEIGISSLVNISPAPKEAVNFERGAVYTVSAKDGSASSSYRVNIVRPEVISSDGEYSLKDAIADSESWTQITSNDQRYYKNGLFGDIDLKFNAQIEALSGDWPSIVFRNQSPSENFGSKDTSCYIIVLSPGKVELHRYNNGVRTQFYGDVAGVEQLLGPKLSSDAFKFGQKNEILLSCRNTDEGVRIIFTVNGEEVFNVLDNYPGAITEPGYFGKVSPKAQVVLSAD
ncbi:MAG: discoidin domain-containing protein [Clostridia bacterium]|nr:discoidin domain-containing protein [Clostridia bacterium]